MRNVFLRITQTTIFLTKKRGYTVMSTIPKIIKNHTALTGKWIKHNDYVHSRKLKTGQSLWIDRCNTLQFIIINSSGSIPIITNDVSEMKIFLDKKRGQYEK